MEVATDVELIVLVGGDGDGGDYCCSGVVWTATVRLSPVVSDTTVATAVMLIPAPRRESAQAGRFEQDGKKMKTTSAFGVSM